MSRGSSHAAHPDQRVRQRFSFVPALVATCCLAVVLGTVIALTGGDESEAANNQLAAVQHPAVLDTRPADTSIPFAVDSASEIMPAVAYDSNLSEPGALRLVSAVLMDDEQPAPRVLDPVADRLETVESHLAAGEFGLALDAAQKALNEEERTELLSRVFDAQLASGEFDTAQASIREIPNSTERTRAHRRHASEKALAGGGSMADFESLMNLIREQTSGEWEEDVGSGGTMTPYQNGVRVDPNGLLHLLSKKEQTGWLKALGVQARVADLNEDVARDSNLRLVSLRRLEQEISKRYSDGQRPTETMEHLAGISQVRYLFIDPQTQDIIIGGPAEAWRIDENGTAVGLNSHKPTLVLEDLVTLLRTFGPGGSGIFGCSINPRPEGLKELKQFIEESNASGPLSMSAVRGWVKRMQSAVGTQDIEVFGVSPYSRVARVIVEADYRMKLIGIDRLEGGPNIPSFFDLLASNNPKEAPDLDALRWWLSMKYDAVLHSPDRTAFQIQGSSVLCRSENQMVTDEGHHTPTGKAEDTNRLFAANFTKHFDELAQRDPVFAELQNIFDLALVAALANHEQATERFEWTMGAFAGKGAYHTAAYPVPTTVESVANHRVYKGRDIVAQVAGGVRADLAAVVTDETINQESSRLNSVAQEVSESNASARRWWWDAPQ